MKKILCSIFAAALMLLGTSAYAQLAVGAGYVNSKQTLKSSSTSYSMPTNGFYAGLEYNVPVGDYFGLSAGANFEYLMSKDYSLGVISGEFTEQYVNVPVHINAGFPLADGIRLFAFAGPTFSYALAGKVNVNSLSYDVYKSENYNRFDVLVGGGAGLDLMNKIRLQVGYDLGMFNKFPKNHDGSEASSQLNRNRFYAGLAFLF